VRHRSHVATQASMVNLPGPPSAHRASWPTTSSGPAPRNSSNPGTAPTCSGCSRSGRPLDLGPRRGTSRMTRTRRSTRGPSLPPRAHRFGSEVASRPAGNGPHAYLIRPVQRGNLRPACRPATHRPL